eukprot:111975_1
MSRTMPISTICYKCTDKGLKHSKKKKTSCKFCDGTGRVDIIATVINQKKIQEISEKNFNKEISSSAKFYIGYNPKPHIKFINNDITGELIIEIQSKLANAFVIELESDKTYMSNSSGIPAIPPGTYYFGPITTSNVILTDTNIFQNYRFRVKGINALGESKWSEWVTYNYKQCVLRDNQLVLHQFNVNDICNKIKWWIYNDIHHTKNRKIISEIFKKEELDGAKTRKLTKTNISIKKMIKEPLLQIMTL